MDDTSTLRRLLIDSS